MPLKYFFYLKIVFLATEWKRANKKNRNIFVIIWVVKRQKKMKYLHVNGSFPTS